jgi:hypothetical protein
MYNWLVLFHIFFAFAFMLAHGVHAAAMLAFRNEKDPERALTFFNIVPELHMVRILMVSMGLPGFIAAFITSWWRQGWVWASALVFLVISYIMYRYGAGYFNLIQGAAERLIEARKTNTDVELALKEFEEARTARHPITVSVVGITGLAIILWLMRFKPF